MDFINQKALPALPVLPALPALSSLSSYILLLPGSLVLLVVFKIVYNVFFHPLRKFPGPWANKLSIVCTTFSRVL